MYRLTQTEDVIRVADGAQIPPVEENADWRDYQAWLAEGNQPDPYEPTAPVDWRPQAIADLNVKREQLLRILTSMQIDYSMKGQSANATACLDAKEQVKVIETAPAVVSAYLSQPGSRAAFNAAVDLRWKEITATAPAQVRADFNKYGGNTV